MKSPVNDLDGLMSSIDNNDERLVEVNETKKILKEVKDIIGGQQGLLYLAHEERKFLDNISLNLLKTSENARSILDNLNKAIEEARKTKLKVDFDTETINTLTGLHHMFAVKEVDALDKLSKERKEQINQFQQDFANVLNEKGFWCPQKAFRWIGGISLLSFITVIVEITCYIIRKLF